MDALNVLEQKFASLIEVVKKLKVENGQLQSENEALRSENTEIKAENAKITEESARLVAKLETIESSCLSGGQELNKLHKEKNRTKAVVEELIKNIDQLVQL
ncbi:MAG: cell division protein ZapB [bacterium]|nr:cell division protein ZapB [bacterium]